MESCILGVITFFLKKCLHGECLLHIKFGFVETLVLYFNKFSSAQLQQLLLGSQLILIFTKKQKNKHQNYLWQHCLFII